MFWGFCRTSFGPGASITQKTIKGPGEIMFWWPRISSVRVGKTIAMVDNQQSTSYVYFLMDGLKSTGPAISQLLPDCANGSKTLSNDGMLKKKTGRVLCEPPLPSGQSFRILVARRYKSNLQRLPMNRSQALTRSLVKSILLSRLLLYSWPPNKLFTHLLIYKII